MKFRAYKITIDDEPYCEFAIAETAKEAKVMAWNRSDWIQDQAIDGFTDLRVKWRRKANITGLSKGLIEPNLEAMRRNFFVWCNGPDCPVCGRKDTVVERWEYDNSDTNTEDTFIACTYCSNQYEEGNLTLDQMPKEAFPYEN